MAVYVDDMRAPFGRMVMCHMTADTTDELLAMADAIGVSRRWLQYPATWKEHFDIALTKRAKAVKLGAIEETTRETVQRQRNDPRHPMHPSRARPATPELTP